MPGATRPHRPARAAPASGTASDPGGADQSRIPQAGTAPAVRDPDRPDAGYDPERQSAVLGSAGGESRPPRAAGRDGAVSPAIQRPFTRSRAIASSNLIPNIVLVNDGKVGIGTTSPATKLDVNGDVTFRNGSGVIIGKVQNASGWYDFNASSSVSGGQMSTSSALPLRFLTNATEQMRIDSSGNVGIGNTAPTNTLSVNGTTYLGGALTVTGTSSLQNVNVSGNLVVSGTVTTVNTATMQVNDNVIEIGFNNGLLTTDVIDAGIYTPSNTSSTLQYSGLARIAASSNSTSPFYRLFGTATNPNTATTISGAYNGYYTYAAPYKQIVSDASITGANQLTGIYLDGNFIVPGQSG